MRVGKGTGSGRPKTKLKESTVFFDKDGNAIGDPLIQTGTYTTWAGYMRVRQRIIAVSRIEARARPGCADFHVTPLAIHSIRPAYN